MVADPEQEVRSLAKKVLWILFAVVLVLALAVAGAAVGIGKIIAQ